MFEAEHVESGAVHALKVLSPCDADALLRFQREAEAMARVDGHPHVLRVHGAGEDRGQRWIAMELARGGSLADRRLPLAPLEAAAVVRDLAAGLAHVHARGVLHRDIKPANVLFDAAGTAKLADYGLARVEDATSLTETGTLLGTPLYMAPEQARGERTVDARADIYALGAVLYHALTGAPPFTGRTHLEVIQRALTAPLAPPSERAPGVPRWLDAVCLQAMARDPAARFPDAASLGRALAEGPTSRAVARGPSATILLVLAVLGAAALVAAGSWGATGAPEVAPPPPTTTVSVASVGSLAALRAALQGPAGPARLALRRALDDDPAGWPLVFDELVQAFERDPTPVSELIESSLERAPTADELWLAAELSLGRGDFAAAERHARAAAAGARGRAGAVRARWARARALLLLDRADEARRLLETTELLQGVPGDAAARLDRVERAHASLRDLAARVRAGRAEVGLGMQLIPAHQAELAAALRVLVEDNVAELYFRLLAAGSHVRRRHAQALLAFDADLVDLAEDDREVTDMCVAAVAFVRGDGDEPEARALGVAQLWLQALQVVHARAPADVTRRAHDDQLAALERLVAAGLSDRTARLAVLVRSELLPSSLRGAPDERARLARALEPALPPDDRLRLLLERAASR